MAATVAKIVKCPPSHAIERATAIKNIALEWTAYDTVAQTIV